ncbi:MAG: peptidoglycan editing factor PgeF [Motilibacteraceae bacterium]
MLAWHEQLEGGVHLAVTDRHGGVSADPYGSLNLGDHVGDDPAAVAENRRRVAQAAGVAPERLVLLRQVHGDRVVVADGPLAEPPEADAVVTGQPGLLLAALVADCTPVLLAAPAQGVVGVAHAGRPGMAAGVVLRTLEAMRELGACEVVARVGPSICARCYEVPLELREQVAAVAPESRSVTRHGTPSLDVAAGVVAQLAPHCAQVRWLPGCAAEDPDLYSYRRDGVTGRYAGLAWVQP